MCALRTALILLLIVLRPALLAALWPLAAFARLVTFGSPVALFFLVVILLHTSDPAQRSLAWSMIGAMAGFTLLSAGLTALQRMLRKDPTRRFGRRTPAPEPFGPWYGRHLGSGPTIAAGLGSYPRSHLPLRRR
jgi:hypothetical protein